MGVCTSLWKYLRNRITILMHSESAQPSLVLVLLSDLCLIPCCTRWGGSTATWRSPGWTSCTWGCRCAPDGRKEGAAVSEEHSHRTVITLILCLGRGPVTRAEGLVLQQKETGFRSLSVCGNTGSDLIDFVSLCCANSQHHCLA